ncbi:MAG: ATP-grasp domain-containing protein [Methanomicrobiales archaeon]
MVMISIVPKPTDRSGDDSTGMVIDELRRAHAPFQIIDLACIDPLRPRISGQVIWVCGMQQESTQFTTLQALELSNRIINTPAAIATCANKALSTACFIHHGVPTPETLFTADRERAEEFLRDFGQVVVKPLHGFDGHGISLATRPGDLGEAPYYLQEYVPNDRDFRVFVIGREAVGAIERVSDSLTHNVHQGGIGRPVSIDAGMRTVAESAARSIGADYCGIDLLRVDDGYTVLEANGTPNWHFMAAPIPRLLAGYLIRAATTTEKRRTDQ